MAPTPIIKSITTFNCNPIGSFASGRKGLARAIVMIAAPPACALVNKSIRFPGPPGPAHVHMHMHMATQWPRPPYRAGRSEHCGSGRARPFGYCALASPRPRPSTRHAPAAACHGHSHMPRRHGARRRPAQFRRWACVHRPGESDGSPDQMHQRTRRTDNDVD